MNVAPRVDLALTSIEPPCASAIERAMNRPSPLPGFSFAEGRAAELLEDQAPVLERHARPLVGDLDAQPSVIGARWDVHGAVERGELDRVVDEVLQNLSEALGISAHGWKGAVHVREHANLVLADRGRAHDLSDERDVHVAERIAERPCFDP